MSFGQAAASSRRGAPTLFAESEAGGQGAYIDLSIEKVTVEKYEVPRGEKVEFSIALHNRGELGFYDLTLRILLNDRVYLDTFISGDEWDRWDKRVEHLLLDTRNIPPGSYRVTVEVPVPGDSDDGDNSFTLDEPIIIK